MRAVVLNAPRDVRVVDVAKPTLQEPTDAVIQVVAACVCGSDLWGYRGIQPVTEPTRISPDEAPVAVLVVPTNEELAIAREAAAL